MGDEPVVIRPEGHEFGEQLSLGQRLFYRFMRGVVIVVTKTYFRARVVGAEHLPKDGRVHPVAHPPLEPRHAVRRPDHPAPAAVHGQGVALEEFVRRLVPDRRSAGSP